MKKKKEKKEVPLLKLDLGAGPHPKEGFQGVDIMEFPGVDNIIADLRKKWPWKDNSVEEAHCSHFIEHLLPAERIHFVNELYRVLIPGGKCQVITPHWASTRAYGDLTHEWPPISEFFWYYLDKVWRAANAPHVPLTCDFVATWGYNINPAFQVKNQEAQQFGVTYYREVAQDTIATLTKK